MSITPQTITAAQFVATFNLGGVMPIKEAFSWVIPYNFADVQNVNVLNGSYTPANDYFYLQQNIPAALSPNFILILCDAQLSLTMNFTQSNVSQAIQRFGFYSWVPDAANLLNGFYLDGRTVPSPYVTPMPQGALVNYSIISGQATLT